LELGGVSEKDKQKYNLPARSKLNAKSSCKFLPAGAFSKSTSCKAKKLTETNGR